MRQGISIDSMAQYALVLHSFDAHFFFPDISQPTPSRNKSAFLMLRESDMVRTPDAPIAHLQRFLVIAGPLNGLDAMASGSASNVEIRGILFMLETNMRSNNDLLNMINTVRIELDGPVTSQNVAMSRWIDWWIPSMNRPCQCLVDHFSCCSASYDSGVKTTCSFDMMQVHDCDPAKKKSWDKLSALTVSVSTNAISGFAIRRATLHSLLVVISTHRCFGLPMIFRHSTADLAIPNPVFHHSKAPNPLIIEAGRSDLTVLLVESHSRSRQQPERVAFNMAQAGKIRSRSNGCTPTRFAATHNFRVAAACLSAIWKATLMLHTGCTATASTVHHSGFGVFHWQIPAVRSSQGIIRGGWQSFIADRPAKYILRSREQHRSNFASKVTAIGSIPPANALPYPLQDLTSSTTAQESVSLIEELETKDATAVFAQRQFFKQHDRPQYHLQSSPGVTYVPSTLVTTVAASFTTVSTIPASHISTTVLKVDTTSLLFPTSLTSPSSVSGLISSPASSTRSQTTMIGVSSAVSNISVTGSPASTTEVTTENSLMIRGVNIGGWLILEQWMNSDVFEGLDAIDQYTFDQTGGARARLEAHWSSYFTEVDVQKIASWGINALRIPIGYWAFTDAAPYLSGADAYLEKAISWARAAGLKVLVDCHGSPGSQNGFDNSGHAGDVDWQNNDNLDQSISILETIAEKYGSQEYADVVYAIELVNEPISWGANDFDTTKAWAHKAYTAVKAKATNPDLVVLMHDGFEGPSAWTDVGSTINGINTPLEQAKFAIDTHLYQNQVASDSMLTQDEHISKACSWSTTKLLPTASNLPVYVGEFSLATNICANPDGTTLAGSVCTQSGCQCSSNVPVQYWNAPLINATRKFFEAEMDAFEHSSNGWFLWSYKGPGGWGLDNAIEYGLVGNKVTDRMFPNQCGFA
nr:glucan 1,3-beta-glucosidase [Quercus suber]